MHNIIKMCVASASELKQSDLYMSVKAVLFTTPSANLNGVRCTEGFIDDIIANQDAYVGLPLSADIRSLESGQYDRLGHMFDQTTGTFATAIIGSFYKFEKELLPSGETALIGYARIMKRNKAVCSAVGELFASGNLKFSFEISCGEYTQLEDGTMLIDASKDNFLEGMCIVWSPACPVAVAKELVAELNNDGKEADKTMETVETVKIDSAEITAEEIKPEAEVKPEETIDQAAPETTEVVAEEAKPEEAVAEEAKTETEPAEEIAEVAEKEEESASCKDEDETKKAEEEQPETATAEESSIEIEPITEVAAEEDPLKEIKDVIAQLTETVTALKNEVAELKEIKKETVVSEIAENTENINPFIAEISAPEKKYSLLERAEKSDIYTLLERA